MRSHVDIIKSGVIFKDLGKNKKFNMKIQLFHIIYPKNYLFSPIQQIKSYKIYITFGREKNFQKKGNDFSEKIYTPVLYYIHFYLCVTSQLGLGMHI